MDCMQLHMNKLMSSKAMCLQGGGGGGGGGEEEEEVEERRRRRGGGGGGGTNNTSSENEMDELSALHWLMQMQTNTEQTQWE